MKASRLDLTVVKKVKAPFGEKWIASVVRHALNAAGCKEPVSLSVVFVGDEEIQQLNREHRKKDKQTDVLSFGWNPPQTHKTVWGSLDMGDIVIAVPYAKRQAKLFKRTFRHEMADLIIHGTLHLLGYDHEKKKDLKVMYTMQNKALKRVGYAPIVSPN